ncbi:hypothetical protein C8Q75DRAFT_285832 [Abortiporus biennis]|nr:hypothetical protein C8Q75DRAFT_285832 [Abortiporus biennis]
MDVEMEILQTSQGPLFSNSRRTSVLLVDELLAMIIKLICAETWQDSALASLARVCKGTHEPALDALWHTQRSLLPVLIHVTELFEEDPGLSCVTYIGSRGEYSHETSDPHLCCIRTPKQHHWDRILKYSKRIKVFKNTPKEGVRSRYMYRHPKIADSVIRGLNYFQGTLFPNLTTLKWPLRGCQNLPSTAIKPFLGPSLRYLYLEKSQNTSDIPQFIEQKSSALKLFYVSKTRSSLFQITQSFINSLDGIETYEDQSGNTYSPAKWIALGTRPKLVRLRTSSFEDKRQYYEERIAAVRPVVSGLFSALQSLHVRTAAMQSILDHLSLIPSFPVCTSLTVYLNQSVPDGGRIIQWNGFMHEVHYQFAEEKQVEELVDLVPKRFPKNLRTFALLSNVHNGMDSSPTITSHVFQSLLSFKHLTQVYVCTDWRVYLDDNMLREMAQSWPNLEYMDFTPQPSCTKRYDQSAIIATLHGLLPFVEYCPKIRELGVVLCSYDRGHDGPIALPSSSSLCKLETLHVGPSYMTSPKAVASFIAENFPCLKNFTCWTACKDSQYEGWAHKSMWLEAWKLAKQARAKQHQSHS